MVNSKEVYFKINKLKRLINYNSLSGNKENTLSINNNESLEHLETKFKLCLELLKRNHTFFSEVIFRSGKRADVISFDNKTGEGYIWEIVSSEKEDSINKKIDEYDLNFELIFIYCNKPLEEQLII